MSRLTRLASVFYLFFFSFFFLNGFLFRVNLGLVRRFGGIAIGTIFDRIVEFSLPETVSVLTYEADNPLMWTIISYYELYLKQKNNVDNSTNLLLYLSTRCSTISTPPIVWR